MAGLKKIRCRPKVALKAGVRERIYKICDGKYLYEKLVWEEMTEEELVRRRAV